MVRSWQGFVSVHPTALSPRPTASDKYFSSSVRSRYNCQKHQHCISTDKAQNNARGRTIQDNTNHNHMVKSPQERTGFGLPTLHLLHWLKRVRCSTASTFLTRRDLLPASTLCPPTLSLLSGLRDAALASPEPGDNQNVSPVLSDALERSSRTSLSLLTHPPICAILLIAQTHRDQAIKTPRCPCLSPGCRILEAGFDCVGSGKGGRCGLGERRLNASSRVYRDTGGADALAVL